MKKKIIIYTLLLFALGCSRVPKIEHNKVTTVNNMTNENGVEDNQLTFNTNEWWTIYGDENLNELIKFAISSNSDIKIAEINIDKAIQGVSRAKGAKIPSVTAATNVNDTQRGGGTTPLLTRPEGYNTERGFYLNYNLDLYGKYSDLQKQQELIVESKRSERKSIEINITTLMASLYGEYTFIEETNSNLNKQLIVLEEMREMVARAVEANAYTEDDLKKIDTSVRNLKMDISDNNISKKKVKESINLLTAYKYKEEVGKILKESSNDVKLLNQKILIPDAISSSVVSNRPDVKYYLNLINSQKYKISALKDEYYPQVNITGNAVYLDNNFDGISRAWGLGSYITLPIFNLANIDANYMIGNLNLDEFLIDYEQAVDNAYKEININLNTLHENSTKVKLAGKNYNDSTILYEHSSYKNSIGVISNYENSNNKLNHLTMSLNETHSKYDFYISQINLISSLGGVYRKESNLSKEGVQ